MLCICFLNWQQYDGAFYVHTSVSEIAPVESSVDDTLSGPKENTLSPQVKAGPSSMSMRVCRSGGH